MSVAGLSPPRQAPGRRTLGRLTPYALLAPGAAWLIVLFLIPLGNQLYVSLQQGALETGYTFQWNWASYTDSLADYDEQFIRSGLYALAATLATLALAFPLAYFVATRGGRWKEVLVLLIALPLFMSFLMRTVAWQTILADDAFVTDAVRALGLIDDDGRLLATDAAVIGGLTYNFLPFMALPLYAALEGMDRRLIEAANDLYASRVRAFARVTLPLAKPGIVAGCLLVFIPAYGDYVNAQLLGSAGQSMIGNVIQSKFLVITDYPAAAAMSFLVMLISLLVAVVGVRLVGAKSLSRAMR